MLAERLQGVSRAITDIALAAGETTDISAIKKLFVVYAGLQGGAAMTMYRLAADGRGFLIALLWF